MKPAVLTLLFAVVLVATAAETRTEVTKATTPADDSKPNSDQVPDVLCDRRKV